MSKDNLLVMSEPTMFEQIESIQAKLREIIRLSRESEQVDQAIIRLLRKNLDRRLS